MGTFDIRIFKLNKWYVPKTHDLNGKQVVIGYFDAVDIIQIDETEGKKHPFIEGYNQMVEKKEKQKSKLVDYSSQEQMIFANISEEKGIGFSATEINNFWSDKEWPYLFISMIHISHLGKMEEALEKIREVFQNNYLCYVSFDYCDLIVFAKRIYIKDYLDKIKRLFQTDEKHLFFDSFSMVSFDDTYLNEEKILDGKIFQAGCERDKFQATVNLSIRDYEKFKQWYEALDKNASLYNMFGRYDVSIVQEADTRWLLNIMKKLHDKKNHEIFWTFETFIKIEEQDIEGYVIQPNPMTKEYYNFIREKLEDKIGELQKAVNESVLVNGSNFILPICEVRDCICSIVKNNFAEELIYCIYESFYEFIMYMIKIIHKLSAGEAGKNISEKKIAESYDNYFAALNALVNSMMHSDRQFIQATTFNAIFYSVPPKIMSFYNVYIYRLKKILMDNGTEEQISYLIYPSFSPEVSIEKISLDDEPPCERILKVKVNEKALYDISLVTFQLVHELAHNIGNRNRCRTFRMKNMFRTLIRFIENENEIADEKLKKGLMKYLEKIWFEQELKVEYLEVFKEESKKFLRNLYVDSVEIIPEFLEQIYKESLDKERIFDNSITQIGIEDEIEQKHYLKNYLPQYCREKGFELHEKVELSRNSIKRYEKIVDILREAYYECYADVQMILVLKVKPEEYLNLFIQKEGITIEELVNDVDDIVRICTIFKVMMDCEIWQEKDFPELKTSQLINSIRRYNEYAFAKFPEDGMLERNNQVISEIKELMKIFLGNEEIGENRIFADCRSVPTDIKIRDLGKANIVLYDLYEYLLYVVKETLKEYKENFKQQEIDNIRKIVEIMTKSEDIIAVYNCIENELHKYGKELFENKKVIE